jgi:hypothetical protein
METAHDFIEYRVDTRKSLLYGKWLRNVNNEEYRQGLQHAYDLMLKYNLTIWLQNSENLAPRCIEDFKWATEEFAVMLVRSDVTKLALVTPSTHPHYTDLSQMRERAYRIFGKSKQLEIFNTDAEALRWLIPNMQHYRLPENLSIV